MSDVSGPRLVASAAGTLAATPLAHALMYLRNRRLSGALELRSATGRTARIDLVRGAVTYASTTPAVARFGSVAYELGFIGAAKLDAVCIESQEKKTPEAELLVKSGVITEAQRDEATVEQIRRRVLHAFTFPPETRFAFADAKPPAQEPSILVDILGPVWRGILAFPPDHEIELVLGRFGDAPLRLISEAALERADFDSRERAVVEALARRPMSVAELKALQPLPHDRTRVLAYFLIIAKCVEPHLAQRSGTMATPREATRDTTDDDTSEPRKHSFQLSCMKFPAVAASSGTSSVTAMIVSPAQLGLDGIRRRAANLASESPKQTLGLPEDASLEAARAAYFRLARVWHPDRLPAHLEVVEGDATRIFLHMTDAYRSIAAIEVAGT